MFKILVVKPREGSRFILGFRCKLTDDMQESMVGGETHISRNMSIT